MAEPKRRPGRPATGVTPNRSIRLGPNYDTALVVAKHRRDKLPAILERALKEYVMTATTVTPDMIRTLEGSSDDHAIVYRDGKLDVEYEQGLSGVLLRGPVTADLEGYIVLGRQSLSDVMDDLDDWEQDADGNAVRLTDAGVALLVAHLNGQDIPADADREMSFARERV